MKVTLSFEKSSSCDVSIMVDALRASTTITMALNSFEKIIPCFSPEEAIELKKELGGVIAGERNGAKIEGFDLGNSPTALKDYKTDENLLILTTSNGTRILENMDSKVLVGSMVNAKSVALKSIDLAREHIDVVMAGVKGRFAIEDFLASGEILYWITQFIDDCELSEYGEAAILASSDCDLAKKSFMNSRTSKKLMELGYQKDVEFCCMKNVTDNVAIYENNELTLYI
ncbi:2-phosphosulfolactate phosphatase [Methanobrevibacter sp. YE315]|uniref:2-phosphosulfolactate phosphatase n=1 Tax=Methanobrevibacter sp. YE315 TaxID=1609968 RepID=UPI000764EC0E|nr:2-phosphosulfolactate phosphatase [Methanobrevibacter sp. YE315]AMD18205.1 2-phosphosulfolactate phosphatase [Methanobrevibacter sp. YE315]